MLLIFRGIRLNSTNFIEYYLILLKYKNISLNELFRIIPTVTNIRNGRVKQKLF